ncbi:helix-turn-helix transcriptional regulator [Kocuria sp. M1R5S2]|uniref:helix-turn-helix transcriptional regulator n=1 Tax=Kocuria rhizosphaerae TaxID=3376285 RepID=UPI00379F7826
MDASADANDRPSGAPSSRMRVLWAVRRASEARGVDELADDVGLHPNTVRFHLGRLEHHGLVRRQLAHHDTPGRPSLRFTAVPQPDREGRDLQDLAQLLAGVLDRQVPGSAAMTERAGRAWAAHLVEARTGPAPDAREAITQVMEALTSVGFAPEVTSDGRHVTVLQRRCPFLEVAREHRDVVCSVQLGLLRGLLERLGAPLEVTGLAPFATPQGCLVHIAAT